MGLVASEILSDSFILLFCDSTGLFVGRDSFFQSLENDMEIELMEFGRKHEAAFREDVMMGRMALRRNSVSECF